MAGNVKLMTSAGGGVVLDTATTTATDVTVKVPVTGVNNGTLVCSDSSGNVGIGTSSPVSTSKLTSAGSISVNGSDNNFGAGGNRTMIDLASGWARIGAVTGGGSAANGIKFITPSGGEAVLMNSVGQMAFGSTLAVDGFLTLTWDAPTYVGFVFKNTGASGGAVQRYKNSSGTTIGEITINTTNTTYTTSSDYRLKENIQPMQGALAVVQQLNPVTYTWKADGSDGQGFIAHELQAVVPDCVTGEKDAVDAEGNPVYQGIDTSFLVATLTKAIQELNEKVEAQAALIAEQSVEITALKGAA